MNSRLAPGALCALALLLALGTPSAYATATRSAGTPVAVRAGTGSSLWLTGTSTLHDYESRTTETAVTMTRVPGSTQPAAASLATLVRTSTIRNIDVTVPVLSLHSPKKGVDKNLWKALKASEHKNITVHLVSYTLSAKGTSRDTTALRALGTITVAGVKQPVTLEGRLYPGKGGMWLVGSHALLMSDFGIKPPKMMLGTLRVANPVTVHYKLLLVGRDGAVALSAAGAR